MQVKPNFNSFRKRKLVILFSLCSLFVSGQNSLNKLVFLNNPTLDEDARSLLESGTAISSSTSSSSFQAIAFPAKKLEEQTVYLNYVEGRFVVEIGEYRLYPDLPDWQLVPIVHFANSPYQSAFIPEYKNEKEISYRFHSAFLDNLLGLRLLQADFLNYPDILWDIPKDSQGNYILAESEKGFFPEKKQILYESISKELLNAQDVFTSYILTDRDVEMIFSIENNRLQFSGNPRYFFIKTEAILKNDDEVQKQINICYKEIEDAAKAFLKEKYSSNLNPRTNLKGLLEVLEENKQNEVLDPYSGFYIQRSIAKLNDLNHLSTEKPKSSISSDFSVSFNKRNWNLLKQYNPLVYSAVENTSHWSAFFRYVRLSNPNNWMVFLNKIKAIQSTNAPIVKTPTSVLVK